MRLLAYGVMRNEAHRYLDACLDWHAPLFDGMAIYDDRSDDDSVAVAEAHGCLARRRPEGVPSFIEHEGRFRQAAWAWFEEALEPQPGDWVLALDADEFVVSSGDRRARLLNACSEADQTSCVAAILPVPEVFAAGDALDQPQVRVDGFWGGIAGSRLFRYRPNGQFRDKAMGCGAEPSYVAQGPFARPSDLFLMHYGYAVAADQKEKYARYTGLAGGHGHSNAHVNSIVDVPALRRWDGPCPSVWRGARTRYGHV